MAKTFTTGLVITGDAGGGVRAIKSTENALGRLNRTVKTSASTTNDYTASTQRSDASLNTLANTARTAAAALSGVFAVGALQGQARMVADAEILSRTLKVSTGTLMEWQYAGEQVNLSAEKMGDIFKDASDKIGDYLANEGGEAKDLIENLKINMQELRALSPDQQILKLVEAMEQLPDQSVKVNFLESLADDAVRLLPLLENNGELLKKFSADARNMGVALADGDIANIVSADQAMKTLSATTQGLANALIADLGPGLNDGVAGLRDWITEAGGAAEVMDDLTTVGGALATLYAGRLAGSIATKTAATLKDMAAERAATAQIAQRIVQEQQAAAQTARRVAGEQTAAVTSARIAVQRAQQAQADAAERLRAIQLTQQQLAAERTLETQRLQAQISATGRQMSLTRLGEIRRTEATLTAQQAAAERTLAAAEVTATGTTRALSAAKLELARASTVADAAMAKTAVSTRIASAAQVVMTGTTRVLSGAMALLGGPAGVALLAGSALYYYSQRADESATKTDGLKGSVDDLVDSFRSLNRIERTVKLDKLNIEISQTNAQIASAKANIDRWKQGLKNEDAGGRSALGSMIAAESEKLDQLNLKLQETSTTIKAVFESGIPNHWTDGNKPEESTFNYSSGDDDRKIETLREQAQKYLVELSRLNATEQQQVANWRNDSLAQTESYYRQGVIKHQDYEFAKVAIAEEAARRLQEIEDQRWNKYTSGGLGDLAQEQRDAQGLEGPRGALIQRGVGQSITDQTFQGLPEVGGLDPQFGGAFGEAGRMEQEKEAMLAAYDQRIADYQHYREMEVENTELYDEQLAALRQKREEEEAAADRQIAQVKLAGAESTFGSLASIAKTFAGEQSGIYKVLFATEKAVSIARSIMAIQTGIALAAAEPFPLNIGAMASVAAATASIVSTISSVAMPVGQAHDGLDYVPNEGTWNLQKGERVTGAALNRDLTQFLERENKVQPSGGGGKVELTQHFHVEAGSGGIDQQAMDAFYRTAKKATYEVIHNELRPGGVLNQ